MSYRRTSSALGSTDYHDGKIPASPPAVPGSFWNNPSFTWYGDPLGREEARYLTDRAAYWKVTKEPRLAEIQADVKMATERGVLVPPPLTAAQMPGAVTIKFHEKTLGRTGVTVGVAAAVGMTALLGAWMWKRHS